MSDIFEYLSWRGDLSFKQDPINEVDYLVLSRLSYLPFERYNLKKDSKVLEYLEIMEGPFLMEKDQAFINSLLDSPRFSSLRLRDYQYDFNKELVKQFFAVTLFDQEGNCYMIFRGTDSTVVGWQEDFRMSYITPVQAQLDAKKYFEKHFGEFKYYGLYGHSKGGNLASYVYFTANSREKKKIKTVVNLDGPGFQVSKAESLFKGMEHDKIHYFVPQGSVVGRLLFHGVEPVVINSSSFGIFQHDLYKWEIEKNCLKRDEEVTSSSKITDKAIKEWVSNLSPKEQELFVDNMFNLFGTGGVRTLKDVRRHFIKNLPEMRIKLSLLDEQTKSKMMEIIKLFFRAAKSSIKLYNKEKKNQKNEIEFEESDFYLEGKESK